MIDDIIVESVTGGLTIDRFTSVEIRNGITAPCEASFELGDDGTFDDLKELTALGAEFRVLVNDRARLVGRVELRDSPLDAGQGSVLRFVVRTRMTDAVYASADPAIRVKGASVRDFILACYAGLGVPESAFVFRADVARDLLTGKPTRGGKAPKDLEPLAEDQAKVRPPESVFAAVDRHLRRHGLMHWDAGDGRIIVAAPDDQQQPLYQFRLWRDGDEAQFNNLLSATRTEDVGDAATGYGVFGVGGGREFQKSKIAVFLDEIDLHVAGFNRPVLFVDEGIKTKELATRRANQERARRVRRLNAFTLTADGLAFDDGDQRIPFAPDTTCDLIVGAQGGAIGKFYVEEVVMRRDTSRGDTTTLTVVREGVWVL